MGGKTKTAKIRSNASWVWNHFVQNGEGTFAKCKLCTAPGKGRLKCGGTTSNLINHLKLIHSVDEFGVTEPATQDVVIIDEQTPQTTKHQSLPKNVISTESTDEMEAFGIENPIKQCFTNIKSHSSGGKKYEEITDAILYHIVKDNQPLNIVHQGGFVRLLKTIAPQYQMPARSTITNRMVAKAAILRERQRKDLSASSNITITSDLWTEPLNSRSFMGATIHFLRQNDFHSIRLGVMRVVGAHDSANIAAYFERTLLDWRIAKENIAAVVTDNAANMLKAVRDCFDCKKQLGCFAHSLNLAVIDSIKHADVLITVEKVKAIVTFSRQSVGVTEKLERRQTERGVKVLKLKQHVETRWDSVFIMLERFHVVANDLRHVLIDFENAPQIPDHEDLKVINDMILVLKPFLQATEEMSGEKYVTVSKVIPLVHCIRTGLIKSKPQTPPGKKLKLKLMDNFLFHFASIENQKIYAVSTLLDPRFKALLFSSATATGNATNIMKREAVEIAKSLTNNSTDDPENSDTEESVAAESSLWAPHTAALEKNRKFSENSPDRTVTDELKTYFQESLEDRNVNPLIYWEKHKFKFPVLRELAIKYLPIIATSVPSERLFSTAGDIMTPERNRLSDKHLDDLLYLHSVPADLFFSKNKL